MSERKPSNSGRRRTRVPLWRWRRNPVRRREDVLEAWLVLAVWILVAVGGTLVGLVTARAADQVLARQRAERTPVAAVVLTGVPPAAAGGTGRDVAAAEVRWTAADGSAHRGMTLVPTGSAAGSSVRIWIDARGKPADEPASPARASVEAGVFGTAAGLALSGLVLGAGGAGRWYLDRRRLARWDREWTLIGPKWGHKTG
ncbi:Rv1733c family protein [Streptomyces bungoensis]